MRHSPGPTDPDLAFAVALAALLMALGLALAFGAHPGAGACLAGGLAVLTARLLAPRVVARLAGPLRRALSVVGEAVGTLVLSALYLVLVCPYAAALRRLGLLPSPTPPWPPPPTTGWTSVGAPTHTHRPGRAARGAHLARALVLVGDAVALLRFFTRRPSLYLVPIVVVVLLLAGLVLLGQVTGLGPLIYTLF